MRLLNSWVANALDNPIGMKRQLYIEAIKHIEVQS